MSAERRLPGRSRRALIAAAACVALGLVVALGQWSAGAGATTTQAHPNIILITTDDQPTSMMRGRYMPKAMKQIAGQGTLFTNMVVTTPLCCPSRASMLTGEYGHNNGVLANSYSLLRDKDNVLPSWLRRAGYWTAHVGKFLNGYEEAVGEATQVAPGWDTWFTTLGATRYFDYNVSANGVLQSFGKGRRNHVTRVLNRKASTLVRRYAPDPQPFYLQLDHRAPHTETGVNSGGRCGARAVPESPGDEQHLRDEPLPNPPSFNEADVTDKPSFVRSRALLDGGRIKKMTKRYECAAAALGSVDRGIKQIVTELRQADELDNTVIVFTSDNGYYFGEHRIARDKTHPYEEGIRVPLLIRVPTAYLGGRTPTPLVDAQVANIDLAPTFLALAGGQACVSENGDEEDELDPGTEDCRVMDGRSLLPLVRGDRGFPEDRGLLIEYQGASSKGESSCEYHGIRASGRFYVEHIQVPDPLTGICEPEEEVELYDLRADPYQLQNLHSTSPSFEESLAERLDLLRNCSGIEGRDPAPAQGSYCE